MNMKNCNMKKNRMLRLDRCLKTALVVYIKHIYNTVDLLYKSLNFLFPDWEGGTVEIN